METEIAVRTSPSCAGSIISAKQQPSRGRKIASSCVFWIGMGLIGIAAIPAGLLFGIIRLILRATCFLIDKIEKS